MSKYPRAVYFCGKIVITYNFDTLGWILKCNQRKIYIDFILSPFSPKNSRCFVSFGVFFFFFSVFKNMNINGINMIINTCIVTNRCRRSFCYTNRLFSLVVVVSVVVIVILCSSIFRIEVYRSLSKTQTQYSP